MKRICAIPMWFLFFVLMSSILFGPMMADAETVLDPWALQKYTKGDTPPPDDLKILVRVVTVAPEGSAWYNFIKNSLWPEIEKMTNGVAQLKLYGGGVLGDEADSIRKMRMRQVHAVGVTNMGSTMMVPEFCVLELPFLFDYEPDLFWNGKFTQIEYILEKMEPTFAKLAKEKDLQFGSMAETCLGFIGTQMEITKADDLKKTKFWLWRGDRIREDVIKTMGFGAFASMELYDVAQAYSTNRIDTTWVGYNPAIVLQWWPHIKYVTNYPIFGYESATAYFDRRMIDIIHDVIAKWGDKYGIQTKNFRHDLSATMDRLLLDMRFMVRREETKARDAMFKQGIKEVVLPEQEIEALRKKVEPLYWQLAGKAYPKELLEEILKHREAYRKLKAEGKFTDEWYVKGIMPDGPSSNEWYDY